MRFLTLFIVLAGAASYAAETGAQATSVREPKPRIVLDVTRVDILLTVSDRRGRFVTDLSRTDFEIYEDDRPQKVLGLGTRSELPLRLAVLLDTSNSIRERFRFIQEAAVEFIRGVMRPDVDKAMLVSFDTVVGNVAELGGDPEKLAGAIRDLHPGGGTSLYDAIFHACRDRLATEEPRYEYRRALIVLSDGEDTQSQSTRDQALAMAQKSDVVIYAVSTNSDKLETRGDKVLKYLAEETGGLAFFPFKLTDLGKSFQQLANELRHQYNIYYRPDPVKTDGKYHSVSVRVKSRKDLVVRARKGYYAPRP